MELKDAYPAILTVIMIGLVLGIGIYILAEIRGEVATEYTGTDDNVYVNGTTVDGGVTGFGDNAITLSDASKDNYELQSIDRVIFINGTTITNYTWTTTGVITFGQDMADSNGEANVSSTYTYDATDSPEKVINDTGEGIGGFADWIGIAFVVIAAAIVLGIVLRILEGESFEV